MLVVQATSGESGQLTCHAPVTSRSVELDFLVGTENPIRLLYRWGPRQQTSCPLLRERVLSAFLAFLGLCWEIKAGFTCDRPADWITGGLRGRGRAVSDSVWGCDWLLTWRELWRDPGWGGQRRSSVYSCDFIMLGLLIGENVYVRTWFIEK